MTTGASSPELSTTIEPQLNDILGYNAIITVVGTITVGGKQFSSEEDLRFLGDALDVVFRKELIPGKTKAIIAEENTFDEVDQDAAKALNIPVYTDADFTYWVNEQLTHTTPLGSRSRVITPPELPEPKHEPEQETDSENTLSKVESPYKKSSDSVLPYPVQALMYDQQQVVPYQSKVNRKLFAATVSGLATAVTYGIYNMGFLGGSMAMALIFGGANMLLNIVTFGLCLTALLDLWKARPPKLSKDYKVE